MTDATVRFLGLECVELRNAALALLVPRRVGPRILSLRRHDGANLLAELPDFTIDCPGAGPFTMWGGHRLWHAPEVARRTYLPDDRPVAVHATATSLVATAPPEAATGLQKALVVTLPDASATVVVDHVLRNHGVWPVTCAPWAITQLKPGGTAILPQNTAPLDADGLQPNRPIALWPYTDIADPHIGWGNRFVLVHATMTAGALKLGWANPAGWLAYHRDGTLFVKQASYAPGADYADWGSSSQCYCREEFVELETLGPLTTIAPGAAVVHREVWHLYDVASFDATEAAAAQLAETHLLAAHRPFL